MAGQSGVVPVRYSASDVEIIQTALAIMGSATMSAFTRSATIKLAKAIIEASTYAGIRRTDWSMCWIEGEIQLKP